MGPKTQEFANGYTLLCGLLQQSAVVGLKHPPAQMHFHRLEQPAGNWTKLKSEDFQNTTLYIYIYIYIFFLF